MKAGGEVTKNRGLGACRALRLWAALAPGLLLVQVFLAVACLAGEERMYVIASDPYPNIRGNDAPAILYRVEGGRMEKVRTITTPRQDTLFVHPYPDQGYVFVGSVGARAGAFLLDVVDLRSVGVERTLDMDGCWGCNASNFRSACRGCLYATSHLLNRGGRLIYMIRPAAYWSGAQLNCACRDLGVDVASGETVADLGSGSLRLAYQNGSPGGLVDGGDFGMPVYTEGTEAIVRNTAEERPRKLGWQLPPGVRLGSGPGHSGDWARLLIDNADMRVLLVMPFGKRPPPADPKQRALHVFDKASWQWRMLELPGSGVRMEARWDYVEALDSPGAYLPMRAFGEWLAAEEIYAYEPGAPDMERLAEQRFAQFRSAAERFEAFGAAPSGRLRLYNARTQTLIVHDTGEPNSEVLYVDEDDVAWYRVSDELRRAPIEDGELGKAELVAKAPELWAVHWLFFGRE